LGSDTLSVEEMGVQILLSSRCLGVVSGMEMLGGGGGDDGSCLGRGWWFLGWRW
jgi:hypothetical protein